MALKQLLSVAIALPLLLVLAAPESATTTVQLPRLYMHDVMGGRGQTSMVVVKGPGPQNPYLDPGNHFGDTVVIDDVLTDGPGLASRPVGRAQGTYVLASLKRPVLAVTITLLLTEGPYNGSTIVVAGRDDASQDVRELAVVGGTGKLRRATGHVLWRSVSYVSATEDMVLELDVHVTVPAPTTAAAAVDVVETTAAA